MKNQIIFSLFILVALNGFGTELESDSTQITHLPIENSSLPSVCAPDLVFLPPIINQDYNAVVSQVSTFGGLSREEFKIPVQLTLGLEKRLNRVEAKRFSVGLGAGLLIMKSSFSHQDYGLKVEENITRSYLTIPLCVKYDYLQDSRVRLFVTAGLSSEFGLSAKIDRKTSSYGTLESSTEKETLNSGQFNVNVGSGINVKLAKHFSLFTEASVAHYFSESPSTVWADKDVWFNLKTGINVQF